MPRMVIDRCFVFRAYKEKCLLEDYLIFSTLDFNEQRINRNDLSNCRQNTFVQWEQTLSNLIKINRQMRIWSNKPFAISSSLSFIGAKDLAKIWASERSEEKREELRASSPTASCILESVSRLDAQWCSTKIQFDQKQQKAASRVLVVMEIYKPATCTPKNNFPRNSRISIASLFFFFL